MDNDHNNGQNEVNEDTWTIRIDQRDQISFLIWIVSDVTISRIGNQRIVQLMWNLCDRINDEFDLYRTEILESGDQLVAEIGATKTDKEQRRQVDTWLRTKSRQRYTAEMEDNNNQWNTPWWGNRIMWTNQMEPNGLYQIICEKKGPRETPKSNTNG